MAMRGIPEYIAQARTILHASVGQVQYGPSAGNIFWYPRNIKPCNIIIIIYINRHFYFNYRGCGQILLSIDTVSKMYQCWFDEIFLTLQAMGYGCDYYVTIDNVSWIFYLYATIECAQTLCAPLLHNAHYATQVRKVFCAYA